MDKNKLEVNNNDFGIIKFPRNQAQADYKISKKKIIRKDGTVFYKKTTTTNDEKISDACIQIFQQSNLAKDFDYDILRTKAENELHPKFKKYNLIVDENKTKKDIKEIEKKQEIAIGQYIRNYIENNLDLTFEVDFNKFIDMTGIKSASRVGNALKMLDEVQNKSSYEWRQPIINEDFSEINYELVKVSTIPMITLILDEEMGEKFETIGEYANSDIKNKKAHIKGIKFDINKSYLSSVLGLGRDYTSTNRKDRNNFSSSYSYRVDILIRSIEKVQHIPSFNRFTFEQIQKKFGTQFKEYRDFKRRVLNPAIKDINEYTLLNVELIEHRENNARNKELDALSFRIFRKISDDKNTKFGIEKTAYYIASRLFYFTNQKIDNLLGFAKHVEKSFNSLDLVLYDNKYINEWKIECEKAIEAENELIKFVDSNRKVMTSLGLIYDDKRMCIVKLSYINEGGDEHSNIQSKISLITTANYRVENPMTSLLYLNDVVGQEGSATVAIVDYLPFSIANSTGWVEIKDVKDYLKYEETIKTYIIDKKINYFKFEVDIFEEIFHTNIMRGNFKEINEEFRNMLNKINNLA